MRYQNWDVLLFPDQSKIPQQEFKTACQVIQDHGRYLPACLWSFGLLMLVPEAQNLQTNPSLLPTITSFIPALPSGASFRVSIHSWENPEISRYIQSIKKPTDKIMFEARVFLDGRIAGYYLHTLPNSTARVLIPIVVRNGLVKRGHGQLFLSSASVRKLV